jgi:DNA-binding transcriptional MerR regulator
MAEYSVSELADLADVTVRTLHYYDEIGLLKSSKRTAAGYRRYETQDLLRLQQILFFKEIEMPLDEIQAILDQPDFDEIQALRDHRRRIRERAARLARLITTIDRTIHKLTEGREMLSDEELFAGFTPEQAERYDREARERWGDEDVDRTLDRLRKMSKAEWDGVQEQGEEATKRLASLIERAPEDAQVQEAIAQHHAWIENFYPAPAEVYRGLGRMYVEHEGFRAYYEKYETGLAEFIQTAIEVYCERHLS